MSRQLNPFPRGGLAALRDDDAQAFFKALAAGEWDASRGSMREPLIFWAARAGAVACMREWTERWGSGGLLGKDAWGRSAAHWAAAGREQEIEVTLDWLFKQGVAIDELDASGATPVGLALALGNQTMAILCAERGLCDMGKPCFRGLSPMELIASLGLGQGAAEAIMRAGGGGLGRLAGPRAQAPIERVRAATFEPAIVAMMEASMIASEIGELAEGRQGSRRGSL